MTSMQHYASAVEQVKRRLFRSGVMVLLMPATLICLAGCIGSRSSPELATQPYPQELHRAESVDIQVRREGRTLTIVNPTARSYRDFDLWINQRYVDHVDELPAGQTIRLDLNDFHDKYGQGLNPGGLFRQYAPTPVRLTEIQTHENEPMIGLVTIRDDVGQ